MVTFPHSTTDESFMDQALALAELGRGQTSPNPMVGAVVVSNGGVILGSGYHERAGMPHAEVRALNAAEAQIQNGAFAATLYCTLEPCFHFGRTKPCVHRIVEAGLRRVVVGLVDPNPMVNGKGIKYLREHGVEVDVGVRRVAAARLNEAFLTWIKRGRPFVTMKIATSLDGRIAGAVGVRTQLTSTEANKAVDELRTEVDAVAVGSTTVLVDDPSLTTRSMRRTRPLTRIVFDRRLRVSPAATLFATKQVGLVVIMTTQAMVAEKREAAERLREAGAQVEGLTLGTINEAMTRLGDLGVVSVLLEGGVTIHRAAWNEKVVDRVQQYVAPVTLGPVGVSWLGEEISMVQLHDYRVCNYGPDMFSEGYVQRVD